MIGAEKPRITPHSKDSEMMVLGCMLTSITNLTIAAEALDDADFYITEHKIVFDALKHTHKNGKPADVHLICEELKRLNKLDALGGAPYITTLAQYAGTSAYIEEYIEVLKSKSLLRKMIHTSQQIERMALEEPANVLGVLDGAQKLFSEINSSTNNVLSTRIEKIVHPYTINDIQEELLYTKEGLKTGYAELDEMVRIPNKAITLVAGRPSHGKTTFMLNLFLNLINQYPDHHFYFFSYEETRLQIAIKLINILSGWIFNESQNLIQLEGYIRSGCTYFGMVEEGKKIYQELVASGRLIIVGESYYIQELPSIISSLKSKAPLGAVFIDYIQKIKNKQKFGTRQLELADTSHIILETAKTSSIPIILGAQLGRDKENKNKVRLENLREAGDLEQDANLVLGLHNLAMEKAQDEQSQLTDRKVELKITPLKNRNGPVNKTVSLDFDRPILQIKSKK